jgi:hypothetical protein
VGGTRVTRLVCDGVTHQVCGGGCPSVHPPALLPPRPTPTHLSYTRTHLYTPLHTSPAHAPPTLHINPRFLERQEAEDCQVFCISHLYLSPCRHLCIQMHLNVQICMWYL